MFEVKCGPGLQPDHPVAVCVRGRWTQTLCVPVVCDAVPQVPDSKDLAHCVHTRSGSPCLLECKPGYSKSADLLCDGGKWVGGSCVSESARAAPLLWFPWAVTPALVPLQRLCVAEPRVPHAEDLGGCRNTPSAPAAPRLTSALPDEESKRLVSS